MLIITHERYVELCLDEELRKAFTTWRNTLIIDEKLEFPTFTYNFEVYHSMLRILPQQLHMDFIEICNPLLMLITKLKNNKNSNLKCQICKPSIDEKSLLRFQQLIESNWNHISWKHHSDVTKFLKTLNVLYHNECLYNGERISGVNPNHKLWGLDNNLILDANGNIDYSYSVSLKFNIIDQSKIIDHKDSIICWIKCNSSASSIKKIEDEFLGEISQLINEAKISGARTLIICHKELENSLVKHLNNAGIDEHYIGLSDNYCGEQFAVNHFGNLIGQNDYRDFKQCWIVGTPNLPMETYIHKWKQYSEEAYGKSDILMVGKDDAFRFVNNEFEQMRVGYLIGELYQSVKRIQRNVKPKAEIFIVTNTEEVFDGVVNELQSIEVASSLKLDIGKKSYSKEVKEPTKLDKLVQAFKELIDKLEPGEYPKKEIKEQLGIKNNFNRLLNNISIKELEESEKIKDANKTIIVY